MLKICLKLALLSVLLSPLGHQIYNRAASARQSGPAANVTAFVGVQVVPMNEERVLASQTVIVRDDVIAEMGDSAAVTVPADAQVIYGCDGLYLMPGLIDMHVHLEQADLARYLASGVTAVRNMWGTAQVQDLIRRINDGSVAGPVVYSAGTGLDGSTAFTNGPIIVEDPARAEAVVAAQVSAGWNFIKVHQELKLAPYQAILAAARRQNIRVVGHVPTRVPIEEALTLGHVSVEHLTGYDVALNRAGNFWGPKAWISIDESKIPALIAKTVETGAWNCPTLNAFDLVAPLFGATPAERAVIVQNRRLMVKALHEAGAKLLSGTDAGTNVTAAGTGLHDELAELVVAGLSPYAALKTATLNAAEFLGKSDQIGSIAVGKRADLILLQANPLEDIHALAAIRGVMLRGKLSPPLRTLPCRPPLNPRLEGRTIRQSTAFVNVHVIPMDSERVLRNQTVLIQDGRIASIEPAGAEKPFAGRVIDGGGRQYLMPGVADMHTHIFDADEMLLYLANGVTTIRNLHGTATHLRWRESLKKGEMLGPRLFTAGPIVDGDPPARATNKVIRTAEEARQTVAEQKQAGYDFLKIYDNLPRELYNVLAEEAAKRGLPMTGHLPTPVGLTGLLEVKGQKCIEHVEELLPFFNDGRTKTGVREMAESLARAGVWVTPTMDVHDSALRQHADWPALLARPEMRFLNPATMRTWGWQETGESRARVPAGAERYRRTMAFFQNTLLPELQRAGVRLLLGTDAPIPALVPGFAVSDELRAFVQSGLTPYQTLTAATKNAAVFTGQEAEFGTVSVGKSADLLLLTANPLEDISNLESRVGVMIHGRWLTAEELRRKLEDLAASYGK